MGLYVPNPNFENELSEDGDLDEPLVDAAESVKGEAEGIVHRIMPRTATSAFEIQTDDDGVFLVNTDYGGHIAEFGSANSPPYAPLRRGVMAAGLRLEEN